MVCSRVSVPGVPGSKNYETSASQKNSLYIGFQHIAQVFFPALEQAFNIAFNNLLIIEDKKIISSLTALSAFT